MTAITINKNEIEVLTASQCEPMKLHNLGKKPGPSPAIKTRVLSSKEIRNATARKLQQDYFAHKTHQRRIWTIVFSGLLTLGVGLGASYFSSNSTPVVAQGGAPSLTATNAPLVYPITLSTTSLPPNINSLQYSAGLSGASGQIPTIKSPSWMPSPNSTGKVTGSGDIALVNGTSATSTVHFQIGITNLTALASDYSSFSLPIDIYRCNPNIGACGTTSNPWTSYQNATHGTQHFLTNTDSNLSVSLPGGFYYDITMDAGQGYYHCIATSDSPTASLSPQFFISATPD